MKKLTLTLLIALSTTACAGGSLKPTVSDRSDARKACPVAEGNIIQVTDVTIEGNIEAAQGAGAAVGGYAGTRAVKDKDELTKLLAGLTGAVAGSVVADVAGRATLNKDGQEIVVVIGGKAYSIIQQTDDRIAFSAGDDVWVIGNLTGNRYSSNQNCRNGIRVILKE